MLDAPALLLPLTWHLPLLQNCGEGHVVPQLPQWLGFCCRSCTAAKGCSKANFHDSELLRRLRLAAFEEN